LERGKQNNDILKNAYFMPGKPENLLNKQDDNNKLVNEIKRVL
jgi:hypothetical protein